MSTHHPHQPMPMLRPADGDLVGLIESYLADIAQAERTVDPQRVDKLRRALDALLQQGAEAAR